MKYLALFLLLGMPLAAQQKPAPKPEPSPAMPSQIAPWTPFPNDSLDELKSKEKLLRDVSKLTIQQMKANAKAQSLQIRIAEVQKRDHAEVQRAATRAGK